MLLCFDGETSRGHFLTRGRVTSPPSVQVVLGGQAMEKWPPELFVRGNLLPTGFASSSRPANGSPAWDGRE